MRASQRRFDVTLLVKIINSDGDLAAAFVGGGLTGSGGEYDSESNRFTPPLFERVDNRSLLTLIFFGFLIAGSAAMMVQTASNVASVSTFCFVLDGLSAYCFVVPAIVVDVRKGCVGRVVVGVCQRRWLSRHYE